MAKTSEAERIVRVEILLRGTDGGRVIFLMDDHTINVALSDVEDEVESLLNALPEKRTLEQKRLADAMEEAEKAQQTLEEEKERAAAAIQEQKEKVEEANAQVVELKSDKEEILKVVEEKLTPEEKEAMKAWFPAWESGKAYTLEGLKTVSYQDKLYVLITSHTSQDDWTPDVTPSLWSEVSFAKDSEGNLYSEFRHPTGAHDAYQKGDRVIYQGEVYESLADSNAYSPEEYAQNWKKIEEGE